MVEKGGGREGFRVLITYFTRVSAYVAYLGSMIGVDRLGVANGSMESWKAVL